LYAEFRYISVTLSYFYQELETFAFFDSHHTQCVTAGCSWPLLSNTWAFYG